MMRRLTMIVLSCAAFIVGCDRASHTPSHLVMGEGSAVSDNLAVSNGNVILKENQPGILFAFVTKPAQSKQFTYFVVFNHDFPTGATNAINTSSTSDGSSANTFHTINAFGAECKVEYHVTLTDDGKNVQKETTSVADKSYEQSKGKLFLIDMKTDPPTVVQTSLDLPSVIPDLQDTESAEKFGLDALQDLRQADETVDEFCKAIVAKGT